MHLSVSISPFFLIVDCLNGYSIIILTYNLLKGLQDDILVFVFEESQIKCVVNRYGDHCGMGERVKHASI